MPQVIHFNGGTGVIYPERLFNRSGAVGRWSVGVARELQTAIRTEAPMLTGRMRRSVTYRERRTGPTSRSSQIRIGVKYARYVIDGTPPSHAPHITSRSGRKMPVGRSQGLVLGTPSSGRRRFTYATAVRGQEANDFVTRGYQFVAARHPAL